MADFFASLIAMIQSIFGDMSTKIIALENQLDTTLTDIETKLMGNPNVTPAQKASIHSRLEQAQTRVDSRFDAAKARLGLDQASGISRVTGAQQRVAALSPAERAALPVRMGGTANLPSMIQGQLSSRLSKSSLKHTNVNLPRFPGINLPSG